MSLITDTISKGQIPNIENIVPDKVLEPRQKEALILGLHLKKCILNMSTGLGKTVTSCAMINAIEPEKKVLIILKRGTLDEMYYKFRSSIYSKYIMDFVTNEKEVINRKIVTNQINYAKVILLSSDCLSNDLVNDYLYSIRFDISVMIVDEMHLFSNLQSMESKLIEKISKYCEYFFALTATPFEREIIQVLNVLSIIDKDLLKGEEPNTIANKCRVFRDGKIVGYKNLDTLNYLIKKRCITITPEDFGVEHKFTCIPVYAEAKPEWGRIKRSDIFKICKGDLEAEPYFKLIETINTNINKKRRGLIYINLNENKRKVYDRLTELGYKVGIVDGSISKKSEREETKELFRIGYYDLLITNIITSLDLECDYIIFYEFTLSYIQFRGRGSRGLKNSDVVIYFILTKDTVEEKKFKEEVLQRLDVYSKVTGHNIDEIKVAFDFDY